MKIFHYSDSLKNYCTQNNSKIGFVPTMGALHAGHMNLVSRAAAENEEVVVSIFVNPAQFNNPDDLKKYPRTLSMDLLSLEKAGATAVFIPTVDEIYPEDLLIEPIALGDLAVRYEGFYRPGHFDGVVKVLTRLFQLITPTQAYFGLKDLQQCLVVEKLGLARFPSIKLHMCPTLRENSGLALSSRNTRLSPFGRIKAEAIYSMLQKMASAENPAEAKISAIQDLQSNDIETEYLDLVLLPDMKTVNEKLATGRFAIVFAGYLEGVRLIDNILL